MRLKVKAGAKRAEVLGPHAGALKISVTTVPERGKANRAVSKLLARTLGVAVSEVEIIAGQSGPDKTVLVGLTPEEIRQRLATLRDTTDPGPDRAASPARDPG